MKITCLILTLFLITKSFGTDIIQSNNHENCIGLVFQFLKVDSEYTTYQKLPVPLPEVLQDKTYLNTKNDQTFIQLNNTFFSKLVSKELKHQNAPEELIELKELKPNQLYTFVITENEIRFATSSHHLLSPKNYASKHAFLAKKDRVHYAGEAWIEDSILYITNNSGTYKPDGSYLNDVAHYFQSNFKIDQIIFVDLKTMEKNISLKDFKLTSTLKAYFISTITHFYNSLAKLITKDNYAGKVISLSSLDGQITEVISFEVGDVIGSGFFGVVHKLKINKVSHEAKKNYPQLFNGDNIRSDLIIKFPHEVPLLSKLPVKNIFNHAILKENSDHIKLKEILNIFQQDSSEILATGGNDSPFLIKKYIAAQSIEEMAKSSNQLTDVQKFALKRDIFDLAQTIYEKLNLDLDIKAENIAWDETNKKFVMYETSIKTHTTGFYIKSGLESYLHYFNLQLKHHSKKRMPADQGLTEIKECSPHQLIIPNEFKYQFQSSLFEGLIDLVQHKISLNVDNFKGCFSIENISYLKNEAILNLSIKNQYEPDKKIIFLIHKNFARPENDYRINFIISERGNANALSLELPAFNH